MKLLMCNDHPVVRLGGEHYIVDTGSPVSFHYAGPQALEVASRGYLLCASPFCDKETADALTGIDVGGFIGMDILQKSGLTIDLENSELEFAAVPGPDPAAEVAELPFDLFMGLYVVTDALFLRRQLKNVIVDTGARIPYAASRLTQFLKKTGEPYEDLSSQFGTLRGEFFEGGLVLPAAGRDVVRSVRFGLLPEVLDRSGLFDGIVGVTALTDKRLVFDFKRRVLRVTV